MINNQTVKMSRDCVWRIGDHECAVQTQPWCTDLGAQLSIAGNDIVHRGLADMYST